MNVWLFRLIFAASVLAPGHAFAETEAPSAAKEATCGKKGQPECPLQAWMKRTIVAYQRAGEDDRLAEAFKRLASIAPAGYEGWSEISLKAAEAAAHHDTDVVRASCKSCHDRFRLRYREEMRDRDLSVLKR